MHNKASFKFLLETLNLDSASCIRVPFLHDKDSVSEASCVGTVFDSEEVVDASNDEARTENLLQVFTVSCYSRTGSPADNA
jgi:hypothetical protein